MFTSNSLGNPHSGPPTRSGITKGPRRESGSGQCPGPGSPLEHWCHPNCGSWDSLGRACCATGRWWKDYCTGSDGSTWFGEPRSGFGGTWDTLKKFWGAGTQEGAVTRAQEWQRPEISRTGPAPSHPLLPPAVSHPQLSRCRAHSPRWPRKRHMACDQLGACVGTAFNLTHGAGRGATSRLSLDRRNGNVVCNRLEGRKAVPPAMGRSEVRGGR